MWVGCMLIGFCTIVSRTAPNLWTLLIRTLHTAGCSVVTWYPGGPGFNLPQSPNDLTLSNLKYQPKAPHIISHCTYMYIQGCHLRISLATYFINQTLPPASFERSTGRYTYIYIHVHAPEAWPSIHSDVQIISLAMHVHAKQCDCVYFRYANTPGVVKKTASLRVHHNNPPQHHPTRPAHMNILSQDVNTIISFKYFATYS